MQCVVRLFGQPDLAVVSDALDETVYDVRVCIRYIGPLLRVVEDIEQVSVRVDDLVAPQ